MRHAPSHQLPDRIDGAERVGEVNHGDETGTRREQPIEGIEIELAGVSDRHRLDHGPGCLCDKLPGNDVGVMLHRRDQDLVAGPKRASAEGVCATRLIDSVVPRVKTICRAEGALRNRATRSRTASYATVARSLR